MAQEKLLPGAVALLRFLDLTAASVALLRLLDLTAASAGSRRVPSSWAAA